MVSLRAYCAERSYKYDSASATYPSALSVELTPVSYTAPLVLAGKYIYISHGNKYVLTGIHVSQRLTLRTYSLTLFTFIRLSLPIPTQLHRR